MGGEQTSCFTRNIDGIETEILRIKYHRKLFSEQPEPKNKTLQKNIDNIKNLNLNNFQSVEQIDSSSRTHSNTNSSSQFIYQNKVVTIQKQIRLFIAKKKFKERLELLLNIIELDNTVNLIKDKVTASKILLENRGEQHWKELITKKKIIPFEDTQYYRKNIKYYRQNKYLISTQLIYIDKYKNNNL